MQTGHARPLISLPAVRRLYFYLIAFVSLTAGLFAMDGLLGTLGELWFGGQSLYIADVGALWRNSIARSGGVLLVATPIFLIHWGYIQRRQGEAGERPAVLRKLFLYAASAMALFFAVMNGYELLTGLAFLAFGGSLDATAIWPAGWFVNTAMIAIGLGLTTYFHHILIEDGDYGAETTAAGSMRRLYQLLVGLAGLLMLIYGSSQLLYALWQAAVGALDALETLGLDAGNWLPAALSNGLALTLLGAILARVNWRRWQRIVATNPGEAASPLRRLYLYLAVSISALAVLAPAAALLREILLLLFGQGDGSLIELIDRLGRPLSFIPMGLASWLWHARRLRAEAVRSGESGEAATVRRIYHYALAAVGLALLWLGMVDSLRALLDVAFTQGPGAGADTLWAEALATGLSLLAVGAPIWALHWRTVQRVARQPGPAGEAERASAPRKIYLYGVAVVGALLILLDLSQVLYRLLRMLLGEPGVDLIAAETIGNMARAGILAALWLVHVMAIRQDGAMPRAQPAAAPAQIADEDRRQELQARIQLLEAELDEARMELARLEEKREAGEEGRRC
jgi:hypothetical protein